MNNEELILKELVNIKKEILLMKIKQGNIDDKFDEYLDNFFKTYGTIRAFWKLVGISITLILGSYAYATLLFNLLQY